ncbi:F-box domain-containing protein [Mycena indigotica]|uniref:F-box domain-containing protein n=1 Tax=Mycena indigotica TaxID=2126181 RepID=A0A8H6SBB8_9AGAR|nr:F-box domain-containing protein [Mycena indigotica]KAF7295601.1 F-box domain-containing protein [Mycena indigotica]
MTSSNVLVPYCSLQTALNSSKHCKLSVAYHPSLENTRYILIYSKHMPPKSERRGRTSAHPGSILSLPAELISEIFLQCLPPYPVCPPLLGNITATCPTILGHICAEWRHIALGTPRLWRAIELEVLPNDYWGNRVTTPVRRLEVTVAMAKCWLERSKAVPLSLILGIYLDHWKDDTLDIFLQLECVSRWEYVVLTLPTPLDSMLNQGRYRHHFEQQMPSLRQIQFRPIRTVHLNQSFDVTQVTGRLDAPKLQTAFFHAFSHFPPADLTDFLPWANLTVLNIVHITPIHALALLRLTTGTSIVACRFEFDHRNGAHLDGFNFDSAANAIGHPNPTDTDIAFLAVSLPRLTTLQLACTFEPSGNARVALQKCMDALRAPALKDLWIEVNVFQRHSPNLTEILRTWGCTLERLLIFQDSKMKRYQRDIYTADFVHVPRLELLTDLDDNPEPMAKWDLRSRYSSGRIYRDYD